MRSFVAAGQCAQLVFLPGVVGVIGQDVDIGAGGAGLQFDAAPEDAEERGRLVDRQVRVGAAGGDDRQVHAGVELEMHHHPSDEGEAVAWQNAEVVTGPIAHVGGQCHLQVTGGSGAWRPVSRQLDVAGDQGGRRLVGEHDGVGQLPIDDRDGQPRTPVGGRSVASVGS